MKGHARAVRMVRTNLKVTAKSGLLLLLSACPPLPDEAEEEEEEEEEAAAAAAAAVGSIEMYRPPIIDEKYTKQAVNSTGPITHWHGDALSAVVILVFFAVLVLV